MKHLRTSVGVLRMRKKYKAIRRSLRPRQLMMTVKNVLMALGHQPTTLTKSRNPSVLLLGHRLIKVTRRTQVNQEMVNGSHLPGQAIRGQQGEPLKVVQCVVHSLSEAAGHMVQGLSDNQVSVAGALHGIVQTRLSVPQ